MIAADAVLVDKNFRRSGSWNLTNRKSSNACLIADRVQYFLAEASLRIVILHDNYPAAGLAGRLQQRRTVDRLDRITIDDSHAYTFSFKNSRCFQCLVYSDAAADDRGAIL